MSSGYNRPDPSIDAKIEEIPEGRHRVKIIGHVVGISGNSIAVNDGTGQLTLALGTTSIEALEMSDLARFVAEVHNEGEKFTGTLITFNKLSAEDAKQYQRIVKHERRIPSDN